MKQKIARSLLTLALASTGIFLGALTGCGGGSAIVTPTPGPTATTQPSPTPTTQPAQAYTGSYVGTYTATYNPLSPISGTFTSALKFTVSDNGTVTVTNPVLPNNPNGGGTGTLTGNQITASGTNIGFGLRTMTGTLQNNSGQISGSGTITVAAQSEIASGTWQVRKQ